MWLQCNSKHPLQDIQSSTRQGVGDRVAGNRLQGLDLINELRAAERFAETATRVEEKRRTSRNSWGLVGWAKLSDFGVRCSFGSQYQHAVQQQIPLTRHGA